ncbi:MAG: DNA adenine methylase, partial [Candidatus Hatepunaea meridiana]|nr:DNA adenine methylase [Candidatus Hatepunaea meridiana]
MRTDFERISFLLQTAAEWSFARSTDDNIEAASDLPLYITNYIGSKQKLVDWIWVHTPDSVKSVLDAFSGSAVVGYMFKTKGLRVVANDRLRYCYHIARAIIENNSVTLTDDEIEALLKSNSKAGDFVQETFRGKFFQSGVHGIIDTIRFNIDQLKSYKKDIALFALGKTCISAAGSYGHFGSASRGGGNRRADTPKEFTERFNSTIIRINELVFDNDKENRAFNKDILDIFSDVKVDLAYFDPPYATEFSTTNYESTYHFIEGLMTYWKGLEIDEKSRVKKYHNDHQTVTQANAEEFFDNVLEKAKGIKYWIISYRDHAYPNESKMKSLIDKHNKTSRMKSKDHSYSMAGQNRSGEASHAKEHLFICEPKSATKAELESEPFMTVADIHGEAAKDSDARVTAFMGSKHDMLDWIWKYTPDGVKSVLDLFSGGANVAYFYKQKGMRVVANDLLNYPYHIARSVIENSSVTLSDEEAEALLQPNTNAKDFIVRTFYGYYYTKPILEFLDNTYTNIQQLNSYKKDIALFALGRTCQIRACFGEFSRSKKSLTEPIPDDANKYPNSHLGNPPLSEFKELFVKCIHDANKLVFDNGQECKVYHQDALSLLPNVKTDLVYADPPYMTQFGFNDYEDKMHFVEGLMTYWEGKEILDNKRRNYASQT